MQWKAVQKVEDDYFASANVETISCNPVNGSMQQQQFASSGYCPKLLSVKNIYSIYIVQKVFVCFSSLCSFIIHLIVALRWDVVPTCVTYIFYLSKGWTKIYFRDVNRTDTYATCTYTIHTTTCTSRSVMAQDIPT